MPTSPARAAEKDRIAAKVRILVAQGLERSEIMERTGISKGHAAKLITAARRAASSNP